MGCLSSSSCTVSLALAETVILLWFFRCSGCEPDSEQTCGNAKGRPWSSVMNGTGTKVIITCSHSRRIRPMALIPFCLLILSQDSAGLCCPSARQGSADSRLIKILPLFGYLTWSFWLHRWGFLPSVRFRKGFYLAHSQNPGAAWRATQISMLELVGSALTPGCRISIQFHYWTLLWGWGKTWSVEQLKSPDYKELQSIMSFQGRSFSDLVELLLTGLLFVLSTAILLWDCICSSSNSPLLMIQYLMAG